MVKINLPQWKFVSSLLKKSFLDIDSSLCLNTLNWDNWSSPYRDFLSYFLRLTLSMVVSSLLKVRIFDIRALSKILCLRYIAWLLWFDWKYDKRSSLWYWWFKLAFLAWGLIVDIDELGSFFSMFFVNIFGYMNNIVFVESNISFVVWDP